MRRVIGSPDDVEPLTWPEKCSHHGTKEERWHSMAGIREGCRKSKWKFKMAFALKGGGGLEGVSFAIKLF